MSGVSDPSSWLTHAEVARRLARSISSIRKMRAEGKLRADQIDGIWRFDPVEVEKAADDLGIREATGETAALEGLAENYRMLFDVMFRAIERDHSYIEKLESTNQAQRNQSELAEQLKHQRELERAELERMMAIKEKALGTLQTMFLPMLLQKLAGQKITPPTTSAPTNGSGAIPDELKVKLADQMLVMLSTLTPEMVAKLKDILPAEHFTMISNVVGATGGGKAA